MLANTLRSTFFFVLMGLFGLNLANAGEYPEKESTEKLIHFLSQMDSMESTFQQWVEDAKKNSLQDVTGTLWVEKPGKFRWDTNEPYPQSIITNGDDLWIYDKDLDQATQKKLDPQIGNTPALLLTGDPQKILQSFNVSAYEYVESGEWRFDLTPKSEETLFELLRVHFIKGKIRDMFLRDSLGQITRIEFKSPTMNKDIKDEVFQFNPPEGVDVIKDM